jgi:hypothetical protein
MTITPTFLTRAAGLSAVAAGLLFIGVQIGHPDLDAATAMTADYTVRESAKALMAVLSLVGITGMYLRQTVQTGILGLVGYVVFAAGYLAVLSVQVIGLAVLPTLATTVPGYVDDVFIVATAGTPAGDVGAMQTLNQVGGIAFLLGGFLFGIALFRAGVLARWAAALLAVGAVTTVLRAVLPQVNFRLFAIPIAVAMIGLGYSLWREQRNAATRPTPNPVSSSLDRSGAQ